MFFAISGFRKYSTLLVIQLFSQPLCLCHCLCICVPNSFLNSYYHKISENVCGASRSEIWSGVTIAGRTNEQRTTKDRATQPMDHERLRWAIFIVNSDQHSFLFQRFEVLEMEYTIVKAVVQKASFKVQRSAISVLSLKCITVFSFETITLWSPHFEIPWLLYIMVSHFTMYS